MSTVPFCNIYFLLQIFGCKEKTNKIVFLIPLFTKAFRLYLSFLSGYNKIRKRYMDRNGEPINDKRPHCYTIHESKIWSAYIFVLELGILYVIWCQFSGGFFIICEVCRPLKVSRMWGTNGKLGCSFILCLIWKRGHPQCIATTMVTKVIMHLIWSRMCEVISVSLLL